MTGSGMRNIEPIPPLKGDVGLRRTWMVEETFAHPAKMHLGLLLWLLERYTEPGQTIADPMGGVGSLLLATAFQREVILREVEPRWLQIAHQNAAKIQERAGLLAGRADLGPHDARQPWGLEADVVLFSPPYGNATQKHRGEEYLRKRSERLKKVAPDCSWIRKWQQGARALELFNYGDSPAQVGFLRNGAYWEAMQAVYTHARTALRPGGQMLVVIKDHVYRHQRVRVTDQTIALAERLGFDLVHHLQRRLAPLSLWQRQRKARGELVVEEEAVLVFTR